MKIKKTQAFTLSELLVVLLLTVIVVGLAFAILNLVQKQMNATRDNYNTGSEISKLRQALWKDFRSHPIITFTSDNQHLYFKNELSELTYDFEKDYVIRKQDTFNIQLKETAFYFNDTEVENGTITALELVAGKEIGIKSIFVYRENAADIYMKN